MIEFQAGEIGCDADAFAKRLNTSDWKPITAATGDERLRADMYSHPDAGPGQVRAIVAEAIMVDEVWQLQVGVTVVDGDGRVHTGTLGKHYKKLTSATRNVHRFARGERVEFEPDVHSGPWQAGDWVIDAVGAVWVRASEDDAAAGSPWGQPPSAARRQRGDRSAVTVPRGRAAEHAPTRPLVLLIRDGYPARR
jgi:hypothetical protein